MRRVPASLARLLFVLSIGGCASAPVTEGSSSAAGGALEALGRAPRGGLVELAEGNPLGVRQVYVASEYRAASGRLCRRVVSANTDRFRVVCRRADGQWSATRLLDGSVSRLGTALPGAD